jgi:hypothetical protein
MFISKVFFQVVFFGLLVSSVIAAPVVKDSEGSPDVVQLSARGNPTMKAAVKIARQIKSSLVAKPGKTVFYTGTKPGKNGPIPVKQTAELFAKAHRKELLGHALAKAKIRIPSENKNPHAMRLWKFASKVYATKSSKVAHAFIGKWTRPGNVYHKIEKPALLKNPKVTKLIEHNGETGETTVVK